MKSAVAVFVILLASVSWAGQPVKPIGSLNAYDANGKRIGQVIDLNNGQGSTVFVRIGGTPTYLTVGPSSMWAGNPELSYQSTDCSGAPFIRVANSLFPTLVATGDPGLTVYVPQSGQTAQTITIASVTENLQPSQCQPLLHSQQIQAFPAVPVIDLSTVFTPPFSVR